GPRSHLGRVPARRGYGVTRDSDTTRRAAPAPTRRVGCHTDGDCYAGPPKTLRAGPRRFGVPHRMTRSSEVSLPQIKFGQTSRRDLWWLQPLAVFLGLSAFIVYSTWAAFQGEHYSYGAYLSPMYSPLLFEAHGQAASGHAWFGAWPDWLPAVMMGIPLTPAFLILWAPGGF